MFGVSTERQQEKHRSELTFTKSPLSFLTWQERSLEVGDLQKCVNVHLTSTAVKQYSRTEQPSQAWAGPTEQMH